MVSSSVGSDGSKTMSRSTKKQKPWHPHGQTLKIVSRPFRVLYTDRDHIQAAGVCASDLQAIGIATGQTPWEEADTGLHEVLHAVMGGMNVRLKKKHEEAFVEAAARGLMATLQDNPEFAQWLIQPRDHKDLTYDLNATEDTR